MNVTPAYAARQIAAARTERATAFGGDRLAYSTSTGDALRIAFDLPTQGDIVEDDAHCFVCGRHTDHFAEHDDMVEAGFATYGEDGSVFWTEKGWNEYRA